MQSSMGPVPVLMPAAMPMPMGTHWAPYPPAATFPQSASHQPPRQARARGADCRLPLARGLSGAVDRA